MEEGVLLLLFSLQTLLPKPIHHVFGFVQSGKVVLQELLITQHSKCKQIFV